MIQLEELKDYCEGKKIIIVGNSSRILNGKHGKLIDSYDIIVRINKGYLHTKQTFFQWDYSRLHFLLILFKLIQ